MEEEKIIILAIDVIWLRKLHILFFGYGSQAKKIRTCCEKFFAKEDKLIFTGIKKHLSEEDIPIVNSIDEAILLNGDVNCVFITSTNDMHLENFKVCLNKKIPYIYVEKPALGVQEYIEKRSDLDLDFLKYIQIGYHLNYIKPIKELKTLFKEGIYGELLRLDLFLGHGLAYKKEFINSWRSKNSCILVETVISHLINLSFEITGYKNQYNLNVNSKINKLNSFCDTIQVNFNFEDKSIVNLMASWGSPLERTFKAYFSNAIWEYDFKKLRVKYPRDVFDKNGYFKEPNEKILIEEFLGIQSSIDNFLVKVQENNYFKHQFNNSSITSNCINDIKIRL